MIALKILLFVIFIIFILKLSLAASVHILKEFTNIVCFIIALGQYISSSNRIVKENNTVVYQTMKNGDEGVLNASNEGEDTVN